MAHSEHPAHTEVATEDAIAQALNYTHALTGMGSGAIVLLIATIVAKYFWGKVREDLVPKSHIYDDDGEPKFVKKDEIYDEDNEPKYVKTAAQHEHNKKTRRNETDLYEKNRTLGERVSKVENAVEFLKDS